MGKETPNHYYNTETKRMRPMLFGRIFIVCVVGIGVPLTRALMYALFLSTIELMERTKDDNRQQWNERNY